MRIAASHPFELPRVLLRVWILTTMVMAVSFGLAGCDSDDDDEDGPTIRLELDWLNVTGVTTDAFKPQQAMIDQLVAEFAKHGITLEVLVSNGIQHSTGVVTLGPGSANDASVWFGPNYEFGQLRAANKEKGSDWHYGLMAWQYRFSDEAAASGSSGLAELPGKSFITGAVAFTNPNQGVIYKAMERNTIMHEFGHNLGLRHGGADHDNWKPNFNSIMNYRFQFDGYDEDCDSLGQGYGGTSGGTASYSGGKNVAIDENRIEEAKGVCGSTPIDWNQNGVANETLQGNLDINLQTGAAYNPALTVLSDFDDWSYVRDSYQASAPVRPSVVRCDHRIPEADPTLDLVSWSRTHQLVPVFE